MDLFQQVIDNNLLDELADMLRDRIGKEDITYKHLTGCVMFFIGGSSILQIIPDKEEKLTYANNPQYEREISEVVDLLKIRLNRNEKIDQIIKKESD
jgi:hypothetical protein